MNAGIAALESELHKKREEYMRLQKTVRKVDELRAEVIVLQRSIEILRKGSAHAEPPPKKSATAFQNFFDQLQNNPKPIADYAKDVLKEAHTPLSINDILPRVIEKGKTVTRPTLAGEIYRNVKLGKIFKKVGPGLFGLLEWEEKPKG